MGMGARSTEQWREHRALLEAISRNREELAAATPPPPEPEIELDPPASRWREIAGVVVLVLLGALWIAAVSTSYSLPPEQSGPIAGIVAAVASASAPLALLGVAYLLLQRTSRREARRFAETSEAMRAEAASLEQVIATLSSRIDDNRKSLAEHGHQLLLLGEDATMRLAEIATMMGAETAKLSDHSERLEQAAATARGDLALLNSDLPRIDGQVRDMSGILRDAGLAAHEQASALEAQLATLAVRGREADEHAGGAAQRLAAHLARIDSSADAAGRQIDATAERMTAAIDAALASASEAVDHTRRGLEAQSAAMLAMVEQSSAALHRAGSDSAVALSRQIDEVSERLDGLATRLQAQDGASRTMLAAIDQGLSAIEDRFVAMHDMGIAGTAKLEAALAQLRGHVERIGASLQADDAGALALIGRVEALAEVVARSRTEVESALPAALDRITEQAERGSAAIAALLPEAQKLEASTALAAGRLAEADAAIARQKAELTAIGGRAIERLADIEQQGTAIAALFDETGDRARALAESAGPQLVEALLRVRETAVQAGERAREALTAVIPQAAATLGEASREALERALSERVDQQLAAITAATDRAIGAATAASEKLARQMDGIAEKTAAIEERIDAHRTATAASDEEILSRRVALLIESLNSTAIDVAKILSNDVTDSAWTAYLKGDRSVFTRRAVRLIDSADAREIMRHYDSDSEFREQVNRYIHDFEGMLRRVLATRDGAPLSVALLSSDMGKLYVALAQAIDRLRA